MTQKYASNVAVNGTYTVGHDTNNNGNTPATPYLSVLKLISQINATNDIGTINPTSTSIASADHPYNESGAIALGTRSITLRGDPLYTSWSGSIKVAVVQNNFATYLMQSIGASGTLLLENMVFDLQNTASKIGFYGLGSFSDLILRRVMIVNCPATGHPFQGFTGVCNITMEDCTIHSTCSYGAGGFFSAVSVTAGNFLNNGGTFVGTVQGGKIFNFAGSVWTTCKTGTYNEVGPQVSGGAWFMAMGACTGEFNVSYTESDGANQLISFTRGQTIGLFNARYNTFVARETVTSTNEPLWFGLTETATLGEISYNDLDLGFVVGITDSNAIAYAVFLNNGVAPGTLKFHHNKIRYNGTNHAVLVGNDDPTIDQRNIAARTGGQNLGDVSANTYLDQIIAATSAVSDVSPAGEGVHSSWIVALAFPMRKVGSPVGTVTMELYADSAGALGTLIATSNTSLLASLLTTSDLNYKFEFDPAPYVAPLSKLHVKFRYTGTINNTDYVVFSRTGTNSLGSIQTSVDGVSWTAAPSICLNFWLLTGTYGIVDPEIHHNLLISTNDTPVNILHQIAIGGVTRFKAWSNGTYGGTLGIMAKGTQGGSEENQSEIYDNFGYAPHAGAGSVGLLLLKGAKWVRCTQNFFNVGSASYGYVVKVTPTTNGLIGVVQNHIQCDHVTIENNAFVQQDSTVTHYLYAIWKNAVGEAPTNLSIDYNRLYLPNGGLFGAISQVTSAGGTTVLSNYATFSAWQGAGYDQNGSNGNPRIANLIPAVPVNLVQYAGNFVPDADGPLIGAGTTAVDAAVLDFYGRTRRTPATIGPINAPDTPIGDKTIAVTGTAIQLPYREIDTGIAVTANAANGEAVTVGFSSDLNSITDGTGNGYVLEPGEEYVIACQNVNVVWINGTAGKSVRFEPTSSLLLGVGQ
jgi:hypothetical protein